MFIFLSIAQSVFVLHKANIPEVTKVTMVVIVLLYVVRMYIIVKDCINRNFTATEVLTTC